MQFYNNYLKDYFNNEKENEKINREVFNINPKLKYTRKSSLNNSNVYKRNDKNVQLKNESSNHSKDIHFRERRAKSISFADISQLSNSTPIYMENYKYNHIRRSQSYHSPNITERKRYNGITRHRSYSNLNGTTILAKRNSFRKPKVLLNSKEHIRRLKKMTSVSAINFKPKNEENKNNLIKRRYSIDALSSTKNFSDIFYNDKFTEDSYSISDLPPNTLYHELKQAHEKELLEKELECKDNELDEETIYYDSDSNSSLHKIELREIEEDENNSFLNLLLKYLEKSINKENHNLIKNDNNDDAKKDVSNNITDNNEEDSSNNIIERNIKENFFEDSYFSGDMQHIEEESELHKQEELLESIFNDVIKNFFGHQTKFYSTILKLISFLLYNGEKLELGSQLLKYILKDKLGINMSSSDDSSLSSLDTNNHINHLENAEIEYIMINDIKESKRHEKIRKKGYKSLNKFWMIVHNIFIFLFLYIFLMNYQFNDINKIPSSVSNIRKQNLENNKKYYHIFAFNESHESLKNNNVNNNVIRNSDNIWIQSTPITLLTLNKNQVFFDNEKSFIDEFTRKKIYHKYSEEKEEKNNIKFKEKKYISKNKNNISNIYIEKFTPWKSLIILECILISAQLGFQYFIMDEIVPFFKPETYTSVLFINQIINFFVQYKVVWKILYNDLCLYIFILGIYIVLFMN